MTPAGGARLPWFVGGLVTALYALSCATVVQAHNDSGEIVAVAHSFGVAHPPGFPTFTLFAGLWVRLLPWTSAFDLALLSALGGGVAAGCLVWLAGRLGASPWAAATAAVAWALMAETWKLHTVQEVVGLAHPMLALILAVCVRVREGGRWAPLALGLAAGLGFGVHPIVVFAAPVVLVALCRRERLRWRLATSAAGLALGLSSHAYFFVATGEPHWGGTETLAGIVGHALRENYGTLDLALGASGSRLDSLARYGRHLVVDGAGLLPGLVLAGAFATRRAHPERPLRFAVVASFALAAIAFPLAARIPDTPWWHEVAARFFPIGDLLGALLAALGLTRLAPLLHPRLRLALLASWLVVIGLLALPDGPTRGRHVIRGYGDDLLASLAPGALLIGQSDLDANVVWEAQVARGIRPDVTFVMQGLLPLGWYGDQVRQQTGYEHPEGKAGLRLLLAHALGAGRPVYVTKSLPPALQRQFAQVPEGIAWRIVPPGNVPPPAEVESRLTTFFESRAPLPSVLPWQRLRVVERDALERYAAPWLALEAIHRRMGNAAAADRIRKRLTSP